MTKPFNVDVTIIYPQPVLFRSHNFNNCEGEEIQPLHLILYDTCASTSVDTIN